MHHCYQTAHLSSVFYSFKNVLAVFSVSDVVGRTADGVTIISTSCIEASLFATANARSGAFVNV